MHVLIVFNSRSDFCGQTCDCADGFGSATDIITIGKNIDRTCKGRKIKKQLHVAFCVLHAAVQCALWYEHLQPSWRYYWYCYIIVIIVIIFILILSGVPGWQVLGRRPIVIERSSCAGGMLERWYVRPDHRVVSVLPGIQRNGLR
jgi:hypothetical protein